MMKQAVSWWADAKFNVSQNTFDTLISNANLNLNSSSPDTVIPILLSNIQNPTQNIPAEVYIMLVAYKLRNHGGHNISQQRILGNNYDDILENMLFSLFLAIQSI